VFSQVGPLLIVGHLKPQALSGGERAVWKGSQIVSTGGTLTPLRKWTFGTSNDPTIHNVTIQFTVLLGSFQASIIEKAASRIQSGQAKPPETAN
jgi:hypothetical protein